ncbi:MAG: ABC transporter permease [Kiritimatiellae bacterium]|nr:ABC transporter permease [Kiritimatiellia bacterium]MDD4736864.1 ABC transporter permease [Kiritimatiellia bacterium]
MKKNSPSFSGRFNPNEILLSAPSIVWLILLFAIPTILIFLIAFKSADAYGNISTHWTLDNLRALANRHYPMIVWRTFWLSCLTTALCIGGGIPVAYFMARIPRKGRNLLMILIVIPFWTNFLIRIFAWKNLLHPEGMLKQVLVFLHLVAPEQPLLYNPWAVLAVLVYSYLPFAILPIYAAAEKFDFSLLEAAQDLGARYSVALRKVFLPGIRSGIWTAAAMVFIPALGSYVIPDIVGGAGSDMIGNKIAQRAFINRNLPEAAMLAGALSLTVLLPLLIYLFSQRRNKHQLLTGTPP